MCGAHLRSRRSVLCEHREWSTRAIENFTCTSAERPAAKFWWDWGVRCSVRHHPEINGEFNSANALLLYVSGSEYESASLREGVADRCTRPTSIGR